jgi:hypothetical protein
MLTHRYYFIVKIPLKLYETYFVWMHCECNYYRENAFHPVEALQNTKFVESKGLVIDDR